MIRYFKATNEDIDQVVNMRLAYIYDDFGEMSETQLKSIKTQLPQYFEQHLNKDCFVFAAKDEDEIVACTMLLILEKPANPTFETGCVGEVLSVYTKPEYRRKGIAKKLMTMLCDFSENKKLDYIELKATKDGYALYQQLGFVDVKQCYTDMKYIIKK